MDQLKKCYNLKNAIEKSEDAADKLEQVIHGLNYADEELFAQEIQKIQNQLLDEKEKVEGKLETEEVTLRQ